MCEKSSKVNPCNLLEEFAQMNIETTSKAFDVVPKYFSPSNKTPLYVNEKFLRTFPLSSKM